MNKNAALVLGCVMVWEPYAGSQLEELVPTGTWMPAVIEYCPAETITPISMKVTQHMRELAAKGFQVAAVVCCDLPSWQLSLRTHSHIPEMLRSQLDKEADVIFDQAEMYALASESQCLS